MSANERWLRFKRFLDGIFFEIFMELYKDLVGID
jgi:hypothetical protein